MARATITRTLMRDLPALPEGTAKLRKRPVSPALLI
jgi:hypothetical protein